ncbi:transglycosylase SLT domain-containing protein [Rhizobium sp. L245/93]|uniref:transglycosylase SLT domain-containing protein n=1 Tax=Rhizobium sp. L245/93 TaxID=2819998 RepID=UPI001ADC538D|nr:transglycosylase SLT domain-containing protein [Rhizobium sp. L245/93]MBO9168349.1 transglycosylase SLT domain-containing protein [Rhizobium sp. L245/93]
MSFIFDANAGQNESQGSIELRRKMALAMMQQGMDTTPIKSAWQGAARLVDAVMGGLDVRRANQEQKVEDDKAYAVATGVPYTPPAQSPGFLSGLFGGGASKVPASDAQGQVAATNPTPTDTGTSAPRAQVAPDQIKSLIARNVPPELQSYATNLIGHESSFNPNAVSPTGATGLAQFTKGTGKQYGLVGPNGDMRADPTANLKALVALTNDNKNALTQALGRAPTDGELALAHQQGVGGAISLLSGKHVPSQNLAVNNIDPNSDPRQAANQIMKFYGGSGGQQVANNDPSSGMGSALARGNTLAPEGSLAPEDQARLAQMRGPSPDAVPYQGPGATINGPSLRGAQIGGGPQVASAPPQAGYVDPQVVSAYQGPASASPAAQAIQQQLTPDQVASGNAMAAIPLTGQQVGGPNALPPGPRPDPNQTAAIPVGQDGQMVIPAGPLGPAQQVGQPQMAPPLPAPVNVANQPMSNPMPADLSGVGMGGAAPGPGAFPPAPAMDPKARLAAALQGSPQPQGAPSDGSARLAAAMQGNPQGAAPAGDPAATPQTRLVQAMQAAPVAPNPMKDDPRVQQLLKVMMNPNVSPQARQVVGAALQQEMSKGQALYQAQMQQYIKQQDPEYQATLKKAQYEADHLGQVSPDTAATLESQRILQANKPTEVNGHLVMPDGKEVADFSNPNVSTVGNNLVDQRTGKVIYQGPTNAVSVEPGNSLVNPQTGAEVYHGTGFKPGEVHDARKEFESLPNYKSYQQAAPVYKAMIDTAGTDSKASDLNLVYGLGKIMDPNSVVREGEMVMVNNTSSLPDWLKGAINSLNGGSRLEPATRTAILNEANNRIKAYRSSLDNDITQYRGIAQRRGMNPDDILPVISDIADVPKPQTQQTVAPVQIKSVEDYSALPKGAQYVDPHGTPRVKN